MFGLVWGLIQIGCGIAADIQYNLRDSECRRKYYDEELDAYINPKGILSDSKTGKPRNIHKNQNGDVIYCDENGRLLRNLTHERYLENVKNAQQNKEVTVVKIDNNEHHTYEDLVRGCVGYRYKDLITGKIVVKRRILGIDFYMDIATGEFIRTTDEYNKRIKRYRENGKYTMTDEEIHENMLNFNKEETLRYHNNPVTGEREINLKNGAYII